MSKKNKIQKQLLRAQIERNALASASGKSIEQVKPVIIPNQAQAVSPNNLTSVATDSLALPREVTEVALIRKDIRLSIILIIAVIVCILVIYFVDRSNPFLLVLANKIFQILQR